MSAQTPLRLLVLEDNADDAELLIMHLRRAGYQPQWRRVDRADDFRAALASGGWDVIVADYSMPQFTAPDALAILKELGLDIPFIIVSGSVGETAAVEAMKAGAHDFFLKDNMARLAAAVQRERSDARVRSERRHALQDLQESQERLRQAVVARDEFLSIASHELKTPLTSLTLNIQSARVALSALGAPTLPADKLRNKLENAARQAGRLAALIDNLLQVTRINSEGMALTPESVDLCETLRSVRAELADAIRVSGSELRLTATDRVIGNWDRLGVESVVRNLISNAVKYGGAKPIDVELDVRADAACMVVTDRGIGIAQSEQERIFHRFERAVPSEHYGGLGLGLWIVRQIVEAHGGSISVASKPQCGSIFTVVLPLRPRASDIAAPRALP